MNNINSFKDFPGTNAQWSDSLRRAVAFRCFREGKRAAVRDIRASLAFIEVPHQKLELTVHKYARSIGL